MTAWRKLRDGGLLDGRPAGSRVGRPTADQAEIARLTAELAKAQRRLGRTEAALEIMGKAHALLEDICGSADSGQPPRKR